MRLRCSVLFLALMATLSQPISAQKIGDVKTRTKSLGDINGDGKPEVAIERDTYGASAYFTEVTIKSGNRVLLEIPGLSHDTADGYAVIGKKVVVFQGDWAATASKWAPHYYNFSWYGWSGTQGKAVIVREGYTRKVYSYSDAAKTMPKFARKPGAAVIRSRAATFAQDAAAAVQKKFGQRVNSVKVIDWETNPDPKDARSFSVGVDRKQGSVVLIVDVRIDRDGRLKAVGITD